MSNTVCVGLKLPHGLVLQNFELRDSLEPSPSGSRTVKFPHKIGPSLKLKGYNETMPTPLVIPHYAITRNCPEELVALWVKDHSDSDVVINGLLLYAPTEKELNAKIKERQNPPCGLEPLAADPNGGAVTDPRIATLNNRNLRVSTADEMPPFVSSGLNSAA